MLFVWEFISQQMFVSNRYKFSNFGQAYQQSLQHVTLQIKAIYLYSERLLIFQQNKSFSDCKHNEIQIRKNISSVL